MGFKTAQSSTLISGSNTHPFDFHPYTMSSLISPYVSQALSRLGLDRFASTISTVLKNYPTRYPTSSSLLFVLLLTSPWLYDNYLEFLAVGPGGMPYNARGWLMALFFKMFERDTLSTREYDRDANKDRWLDVSQEALPTHQGPRPHSGWHVVPVRQCDQLPSEEMAKVSVSVVSYHRQYEH